MKFEASPLGVTLGLVPEAEIFGGVHSVTDSRGDPRPRPSDPWVTPRGTIIKSKSILLQTRRHGRPRSFRGHHFNPIDVHR